MLTIASLTRCQTSNLSEDLTTNLKRSLSLLFRNDASQATTINNSSTFLNSQSHVRVVRQSAVDYEQTVVLRRSPMLTCLQSLTSPGNHHVPVSTGDRLRATRTAVQFSNLSSHNDLAGHCRRSSCYGVGQRPKPPLNLSGHQKINKSENRSAAHVRIQTLSCSSNAEVTVVVSAKAKTSTVPDLGARELGRYVPFSNVASKQHKLAKNQALGEKSKRKRESNSLISRRVSYSQKLNTTNIWLRRHLS